MIWSGPAGAATRPDRPVQPRRQRNRRDGLQRLRGAASGRPVVLLIGDVALAHDIGGLLAARRLGLELTIVALNNDGGGIFNFLPISDDARRSRRTSPPRMGSGFEHAAALYGLEYAQPATTGQLEAALQASIGSGRTTIIEIRTDRVQNLALHRRLADRGLAAIPSS